MSAAEPSAVLRSSALLEDFSPSALESLLAYFDVMQGKRGDRLFRAGERSDGLFVVADGSLVVVATDESGIEQRVGKLAPGDSFGELALLLRGERFVSVEALTDVTVYEMSYASFRRLKASNPDLCLLVIMAIVRRFGRVIDGSRDALRRLLVESVMEARDA